MALTENDFRDIADLLFEFAWRVDHDDGLGVEDLFADDGTYNLNGWALTGRSEIRQFYDDRRNRGPRTSRHVFANHRIRPGTDDGFASGDSVLTLHAHDGHAPHPLTPVMVADYADTYRRSAAGTWEFTARVVSVQFLATLSA